MIKVKSLFYYPIKSCAGIEVSKLEIGSRGPLWDRNWLIVDENNSFLTQRQLPLMAKIKTSINENHLQIEINEDKFHLEIPKNPETPVRNVKIWNDFVDAHETDDKINSALSDFLKLPCRLVQLGSESKRQVNTKYVPEGHQVGFADGFPFLMISQESLDFLNEKLKSPVPMNRFRPNIVIEGGKPHIEDSLTDFSIGGVDFSVVKPCTRCIITTIDQKSAQKMGAEPLKTLSTYRTSPEGKVNFGQNLIHNNIGEIKVGDQLILKSDFC